MRGVHRIIRLKRYLSWPPTSSRLGRSLTASGRLPAECQASQNDSRDGRALAPTTQRPVSRDRNLKATRAMPCCRFGENAKAGAICLQQLRVGARQTATKRGPAARSRLIISNFAPETANAHIDMALRRTTSYSWSSCRGTDFRLFPLFSDSWGALVHNMLARQGISSNTDAMAVCPGGWLRQTNRRKQAQF